MPPVDTSLPMSSLQVDFMAKRSSWTSSTYQSFILVGIADQICPLLPHDEWAAGVTWIDTIDLTGEAASSIHEVVVPFDSYSGSGRHVVFYSPVPELTGSNTYAYNDIYLDDITLRLIPSCPRPSLTLSATAEGTMQLTIVDSAHVGNYEVTLTPDGGTATVVTTADSTVTFTGLAPMTHYSVSVTVVCGDGTATIPVSTDFDMPFIMSDSIAFDFEDSNDDSYWALLDGGRTNRWAIGTGAGDSRAMYISNDGGTSNAYTLTNGSAVYAYTVLQIDSGLYSYSYDWRCNGEKLSSNVPYDYMQVALLPADATLTAGANVPSGWYYGSLPYDALSLNGGYPLLLNAEWQHKEGKVEVPGGMYKLAVYWRNSTTTGIQPPAAVDNISLQRFTQLTLQDTLYTEVHDSTFRTDTLTLHDTLYTTEYYPVHDSIFRTDTLTVDDTVYVTEYYAVHDSTYRTDTLTVNDTVYVTEYYAVHDSTYRTDTLTLHDTVWVTELILVHDTTYRTDTLTVTDTLHLTEYLYQHDTLHYSVTVVLHDTLWITDTMIVDHWLHDTLHNTVTVVVHDTIHITDTIYTEGVADVTAREVKIAVVDGNIVVESSDGSALPAVRVYDAVGRRIAATADNKGAVCRIEVPTSGVYLVKVGTAPARRVVVIR